MEFCIEFFRPTTNYPVGASVSIAVEDFELLRRVGIEKEWLNSPRRYEIFFHGFTIEEVNSKIAEITRGILSALEGYAKGQEIVLPDSKVLALADLTELPAPVFNLPVDYTKTPVRECRELLKERDREIKYLRSLLPEALGTIDALNAVDPSPNVETLLVYDTFDQY